MSADELWAELERVRADPSSFPFECGQAWSRWFAQAIAEGNDPSRMRRDAPTLSERIAAFTLEGLDGCLIWDGPMDWDQPICHTFGRGRSSGSTVRVRRWLLANDGRPAPSNRRTVATCGNKRCVALAHLHVESEHWLVKHSTASMLSALRTATEKLGRTPWGREWDQMKLRPSSSWFYKRFGTWGRACELAGLPAPKRIYRRKPSTHCKRGHEQVGDTVYTNPTTGRHCCRRCKALIDSERRANRRKEAACDSPHSQAHSS